MAEQSNLNKEIEALKADLASLRSDISRLTGAARDDISDFAGSARDRGQKMEEGFEKRIGEHPWSSLLTAIGVGFVLAKVMDRGGRD